MRCRTPRSSGSSTHSSRNTWSTATARRKPWSRRCCGKSPSTAIARRCTRRLANASALAACTCWTWTSTRCRWAWSVSCTSADGVSRAATIVIRGRAPSASSPIRSALKAGACTAPVTWCAVAKMACSTTSGASTIRSRCAASASNWAKSKPACASRPGSTMHWWSCGTTARGRNWWAMWWRRKTMASARVARRHCARACPTTWCRRRSWCCRASR
ncbi:hypothetical protein D3C78_941120 [compost metagenome]